MANERKTRPLTVGELSRRTGVPVADAHQLGLPLAGALLDEPPQAAKGCC